MSVQNQVSLTFLPDELQKIREATAILSTVLKPKLIQLKPDDRQQMAKMGDRTINFVSKAFEHAERNPELTPRYFDLEEAKIDFTAVTVLREFSSTLSTVSQMIDDTMTVSGSEAYSAALSFYGAIKAAAKNRQPGAEFIFEDLKSQFQKTTAAPKEMSAVSA